jgi:hypothetical protein
VEHVSQERLRRENQANLAHNRILESFGVLYAQKIEDGQDVFRMSENYKFDDNYAGAYINSEGRLVVLVAAQDEFAPVKNKEGNILSPEIRISSKEYLSASDKFRSVTASLEKVARDDSVLFQAVKYSYAHLEDLKSKITSAIGEKEGGVCKDVVSIEILDNENCVRVNILNINDEKIRMFKENIIDSEAITYATVDHPLCAEATTIYPGNIVYNNVTNGSLGYRSRYGNEGYGFVTAAHVLTSIGAAAYNTSSSTSLIGYVTVRQYSGNLDVAFVPTNSNYTMSNKVASSSGPALGAGYSSPALGTTVYKVGATTGSTSGSITSTNATAVYDGHTIYNTFSANYLSDNGDSGGVVYVPNLPVGIHVAGPFGGGAGTRYIIKAGKIDVDLGVYPY